MKENNENLPYRSLSQEEGDKIFGKYKSYDDYFLDPDQPYAMVKVFIDGNELKAGFTVEFTQKTNDHDTFKIITPDDSFDAFEKPILDKSRHLPTKNVTIQFARFGKIQQIFEGIITNIKNPRHEGGGYGDLHLMGSGNTILLETGKDCQSFENKTLAQIINEICERYPSEAKIKASDNYLNLTNRNAIPYTVQYKESDYEFIKRLAKRHGEFFYNTSEGIVFGNKVQPIVELNEGEDLIEEIFSASLQAQDFKFLAYDAESGTVFEKDSRTVKSEFKENHFGAMSVIASRKLFTKNPVMQFGNAKNQWELDEAVRLEKERLENLFFVKGKSRAPELKIGGRAEMKDINGKAMETYRIIEIRHYHDGFEYYNEFIGIPDLFNASPFIDTEAVPFGEIQSARVMDNNDPKKMGRVRVQFPWQMAKNQMTPWLRITTLYAGAGKGMYMIPEIGEEVLVAYESNNAEKPFVLGALYNGAETSGYATADNDLKVFKTRSGIEDLKNDAEGSWKRSTPDGSFIHQDGQGNININATNNLNITVGKDMRVNIGENMTYFVGINSFFNSGTNITMTTPEMKQYIADYYHTQAGKALINSDNEIKIEAKQTKVAGFEKVLVHSNDSTVINSKKIVDIKGQEGTNHTNVAEDMADNEIILDAMALVVFRPHESWVTNWNYNIDWFREGFGGGTAIGGTSIKGDEDFYTIAGHYLNNDQKNSFTLDTVIADNLKSEYLKAVGQQKDPIQEEGKPTKYIPYDYYIPRLTIYKHEAEAEQTIANITINYDVYEEPNKLILEYEEEFFEISEYKDPNEVVLIGKSNKPPKVEEKVDYTPPEKHKIYEIKSKSVTKTSFRSANISIECKQPFGTLGGKFINAYTLQKGEDGKIIKKQAGVLQVMPNNASYRKTLNIVMINVITDIDADGAVENGYDATLLEKEKKHLRILLRQSLIDPVFSTIDLHFDGKSTGTITTRDHFNSTYISSGALLSAYERGSTIPTGWKNLDIYLNDKFQELSESPNYTNHTKLFYLPQSDLMIVQNNVPTAYGGYNSGSNHLNIVLPKQGSKYASSHEAYHRLGLPHTWQNKNNLDRIGGFHPSENNGKYSFKYGTTFNIMDYCSEKYYLYYWQMQIACSSATAEPANYIPQIL